MPVRNERATISAALDSALAQVVQAEFEVVVADGQSDDGTRELIEKRAVTDRRLRVVDNPACKTPQGLNAALAAARGRYWVRLDGHSLAPPDYVERLVRHIRDGRCDAAGGVVRGLGSSAFGRAVAVAHDSRFGIGNARHHYATEVSFIDHVSHGAYRVDLSRAIGGFDEDLVRNQDYDFDFRYREAGGRIIVDPEATFERRVRETPRALARQFHEYGYWKAIVIRRHPRSFHLRWLAPPALVATLATGALFRRSPVGRRLASVTATVYGSFVAVGAVSLGRRVGMRLVPHAALGLATMHLAWGSGFLRGAARIRRA